MPVGRLAWKAVMRKGVAWPNAAREDVYLRLLHARSRGVRGRSRQNIALGSWSRVGSRRVHSANERSLAKPADADLARDARELAHVDADRG